MRFTIVSSTTIVATVDAGASGNIAVTTPSGTAVLQGFTYINAPNISYNTPQNYGVGIAITPLAPANSGGPVPATIYGQTSTYAGTGNSGSTNGSALTSTFYSPTRVAADLSGNLYVADRDNNLIRKISSGGLVTTFASGFNQPNGVTVDLNGNVYVADAATNSIKKITPTGSVTVVAGNGSMGSNNGIGSAASFYYPFSVTVDGAGNLYVSDNGNNLIRKIDLAGAVTTLAGSGMAAFADGTGTAASFYGPCGGTLDAMGNLYIADGVNNRVRKVTPLGVVTTVAGNGTRATINGNGTSASLNTPTGATIDIAGIVYVAELDGNCIRKVDPSGNVTILAGSNVAGSANGIGTAASFRRPNDVQADQSGFIYVTDYGNNVIRKILTTGYAIDKTLPPGLTFDPTTGIISGTPTATSPSTIYTITAYNTAGSSTTTVTISVSLATPQTITFPPLNSVIYGAADFSAGATSTNNTIPITYTSSNPAVATVSADGKVHVVGVGQTTITALQAGNSIYNAATPVSQTLTVTPAALIVTISNQTKTYGAANPNFTFTYAGFVNGDDATKLSAQPGVVTTASASSPVGVYTVTGGNAASANYTLTYISGTLTILPAPLIITANNQTRIYGIANPALSLTYTSFVNGDDASKLTAQPTVSTIATATSAIGTYPITVSGASNANYNISYLPGTLTITVAPRILTFNPIPDKVSGDIDFDPGATINTNDAITYASSNPSVATIVNGKIHITGVGSVTITASVAAKANYQDVSPKAQQLLVTDINNNDLAIHPVVTPNGDGINDVLRIDGIKKYPDNKLTLVNVNGIKVFEASGYDNVKNVFDGHSNITGAFQPQGTYFYSLQYHENGQSKRKVGYVVLKY